MKPQKLVVIETSDIGARYTAEAAKSLGFEPVFLCRLANYQADTLSQIREYEHYDVATGSAEDLAAFVRAQNWDVFGVTTLLDSRLEVAIECSQILGVRGLDPAAAKLKDKSYSQAVAPHLFPETIEFSRDRIPTAQLRELLKSHGSIIVKPRFTAGAIGLLRITSESELICVREHLVNTEIADFLRPDLWLAQACIDGDLVSVEGFVHAGAVRILGISGRQKINKTETVITFPTRAENVVSCGNSIRRTCLEFMSKTGFQNGFFHVEMLVGANGPSIIDPNVGRPGGGGLGEQLALAFDISPVELYSEVLNISLQLGHSVSPRLEQEPNCQTASVMYGLGNSGYVKDVRATRALQSMHTLIWGDEQIVAPQGENNWSWVGIMTGIVPQVYDDVRSLTIQTERGSENAVY